MCSEENTAVHLKKTGHGGVTILCDVKEMSVPKFILVLSAVHSKPINRPTNHLIYLQI
jgi:hypothetical protein